MLIFLLLYSSYLIGNSVQIIQNGPIHEAFVTQESGNCILQTVPDQPPFPLKERPGVAKESTLEWIPGYWAWVREIGDYIWISGIWRRPPPGAVWVPGEWRHFSSGWVWFKGFWNPLSERPLNFIPNIPPDPINERIPPPPASARAYMWMPGYWGWVVDAQEFRWYAGKWERIEKSRYYTPPQYYFREEGYVFVPGYWDWPLEARGEAHADLIIPAPLRDEFIYEISHPLSSLWVMELLFPNWPNYLCLFRFHFHFHHAAWVAWGNTPPWWNWSSWWSLPPQDAWWLWWWWSHPGYINPPWIEASLAKKIPPPSAQLVKFMHRVKPPLTVTNKGVLLQQDLIEAIEKVTGKRYPILTSDPKQVEQIQDLANKKSHRSPPYIRATGEHNGEAIPAKPLTDSSDRELKLAPGRIKLPSPAQVMQPLTLLYISNLVAIDQLQEFSHHPKSNPLGCLCIYSEYLKLGEFGKEAPQNGAPERATMAQAQSASEESNFVEEPTEPKLPISSTSSIAWGTHFGPEPPHQGRTPIDTYTPPDMQSFHLDDLMQEPQPQRNPPQPKVNSLPGYEAVEPLDNSIY